MDKICSNKDNDIMTPTRTPASRRAAPPPRDTCAPREKKHADTNVYRRSPSSCFTAHLSLLWEASHATATATPRTHARTLNDIWDEMEYGKKPTAPKKRRAHQQHPDELSVCAFCRHTQTCAYSYCYSTSSTVACQQLVPAAE